VCLFELLKVFLPFTAFKTQPFFSKRPQDTFIVLMSHLLNIFHNLLLKIEIDFYDMRGSLLSRKKKFLSWSVLLGIMLFLSLRRVSEEEFESDVTKRMNIMQEACKHHGLTRRGEDSLHQPYSWEYLIANEKNATLVWCNIFKSGSSR
jgi:hypothetical protein